MRFLSSTQLAVSFTCVALSLSASAFACGEDKDGSDKDDSVVSSLCGEDKDGSDKDDSVVGNLL